MWTQLEYQNGGPSFREALAFATGKLILIRSACYYSDCLCSTLSSISLNVSLSDALYIYIYSLYLLLI